MLEESGVWCNLDVPIPLNQSPIVPVMLDLLEAVSEDMPREHVVRLLSSPYIRFRYGEEGKGRLSGGMVSSYGEQAGVIGGVAQWKERWSAAGRHRGPGVLLRGSRSRRPGSWGERRCGSSVNDGLAELFVLLGTVKGTMTAEQRVVRLKPVLGRLETDRHLAHEDERVHHKEARSLAAFFGVLDTISPPRHSTPWGKRHWVVRRPGQGDVLQLQALCRTDV